MEKEVRMVVKVLPMQMLRPAAMGSYGNNEQSASGEFPNPSF